MGCFIISLHAQGRGLWEAGKQGTSTETLETELRPRTLAQRGWKAPAQGLALSEDTTVFHADVYSGVWLGEASPRRDWRRDCPKPPVGQGTQGRTLKKPLRSEKTPEGLEVTAVTFTARPSGCRGQTVPRGLVITSGWIPPSSKTGALWLVQIPLQANAG